LYSNRQSDNIAVWVKCQTKCRKNVERNSEGALTRQTDGVARFQEDPYKGEIL
jgi:hypothetical protein